MPTAPLGIPPPLRDPGNISGTTQITTGAIQGTATDETGAPVPGVTIEARNVGTNLTRTQVTAADGRFVFLQLPPGTYRLTFKLQGFATFVQDEIPLTVGQTVTIPAAMKVGGVQEIVTVSGSPVVESTRTSAATTRDENRRKHPEPRTQVRGPADADARCVDRAGA